MNLATYVRFYVLLAAVDATVLTYLYSVSADFVPAFRAFIAGKLLLDAVFVGSNLRSWRCTTLEVVFLAVLASYGVVGAFVLPSISGTYSAYRALNDTMLPFLFIVKIGTVRALLASGDRGLDLRRLARWLLLMAGIQTAVFLSVSMFYVPYAGITPPVNLPLANGIASHDAKWVLASLAMIVLSGKRSYLVAAAVALLVYFIYQRRTRVIVALGAIGLAVVLTGIVPIDNMRDKVMMTVEGLQRAVAESRDAGGLSEEARDQLFLATAGRSEEVLAILLQMQPWNYVVGLGAGFTYTWQLLETSVEGYANTHFSPLALAYKFGVPFALCLYWYIFRHTRSAIRSESWELRVAGYCLLLLGIQSLFAFNLFLAPLLGLVAALTQVSFSSKDSIRMDKTKLKKDVGAFWEKAACGEVYSEGDSDLERLRTQAAARYQLEPYIFDFANFREGAGRDVLEIGVGMGADHLEWAKHRPATLTGVDFTARAVETTARRCALEGARSRLLQADGEKLPFGDASFDLVYSYGVLHHSPDTAAAFKEVQRVLRPGGTARIMIYQYFSITGYILWLRYALMAGRPARSLRDIYAEHLESPGTQAFTEDEARAMCAGFSSVTVKTQLSFGDLLEGAVGQRHQGLLLKTAKALWPRALLKTLMPGHGLLLLIEAKK